MSAIDPAKAEKLFAAISEIRAYLPEAEVAADLVFPQATPGIKMAESALSAVFELVSKLSSSSPAIVDDAAARLRTETETAWTSDLKAKP